MRLRKARWKGRLRGFVPLGDGKHARVNTARFVVKLGITLLYPVE